MMGVARFDDFDRMVRNDLDGAYVLFEDYNSVDTQCELQRATIQQLEAQVKDMEDRLFRHKEMDNPPCFCCGYNGPLYYQPSVHACAARYHKCNQNNP